MMRDLLFFCACVVIGYLFLDSQAASVQERSRRQQELLTTLGAAEMLPEQSAERSLLQGQFGHGLQQSPDPETYEKLAELFLAEAEDEVAALAFNRDLLGRILGKKYEFFDSTGRDLKLETVSLDQSPVEWELTGPYQLKAEGVWLVYRDPKRTVAFRRHDRLVRGFVASEKLTIEGDTVTGDRQTWIYQGGLLEEQP